MVEMLGEIAAKPDDGLGRFRNGWLGGFHAGKIQQGAPATQADNCNLPNFRRLGNIKLTVDALPYGTLAS